MKNSKTPFILGLALAGTLFAIPAMAQRTRTDDARLLEQFDTDGNGWLDAEERVAAREFHAAKQAESRRPGRRGGRRAEPEPVKPGRKLSVSDVEQFPNAPLYDHGTLRTIFLEFENDNWYEELDAFYHTDVELPASLTVDGETYSNVGVQHRGNSSFFATGKGRKKSMSITLDHVIKGQNIGGYRALTLLNAHADPTFLHSVLYLAIASEYLPAPKANYVRVVINGESWGIYINQQRFNKDFLEDAFGTTQGIRFKSAKPFTWWRAFLSRRRSG